MQINNHSNQNIHLDVTNICKPLLDLFDINFFRYLRVYPDQSRVHLCTNPTWTSLFYQKGFYHIAWCDSNKLGVPSNQEIIWDTKALTDDNIVGVTARVDFDICHGMSMVRAHPHYYEVFDFATSNNNTAVNNYYMHALNYFDRFIFYFKDQARKLISEADKKRIQIPNIVPISKLNPIFVNVDNFIKATHTKRYYINTTCGDIYLTQREIECIYWAFMGRSTKETSIIMKCAKRTVDDHFTRIKSKLNVTKITEIIKICVNSEVLKGYIMQSH